MDNFVNLHNHSDYSLLDGFGTVDEYIARAVEMGQPALGLTDHGNVCGLFSFIQKCNKAGIKPIPGIEAYVAPVNPMGAKVHQPVRYGKPGQEGIDVSGNGAYLHMTLWAMNDEGLHSLYALVREASMEGNEFNHLDLPDGEGNYYMKPRMDLDMLARHNAGLIATTGCPSGEIQTRFRLGQDEQAYDYARRMSEIFEGRYFVELMDHSMAQGKDIERVSIPKLLKLADDLNLPLLATNDSHYCNHEDAPHHEEMLCANSKATMYDLPYDEGGKRFAFNGNEYYLKTRDEMLSIPVFHEHPEAVDNTMRIADMVEHIEFKLRSDLRPEVEIPDGYDEIGWFKHEIKEGLKKKRSDASPEVKAEAVKRINHELPVFTDNNFVQYMLVVKDYIDWARNNGIRVGYGRGSVGGSEIAFDLNISDTDPIRHNLMFERFLNPERLSPPDVDTDFAASRRDEVVDYVKDKYGEDHIANIITFNKFLSKTALADMARIYNIPVFESNKATKLIPEIKPNQGASLSDIYDEKSKIYTQAAEFRKLMEEEKWKPVIAAARAIEGRIKTTGVHACGIIMSSHPITDAAPMTYKHKPSKPWGSSCCQWTYEELESIGLIKMDFLSLSDLDIVGDTLANIMHTHDGKTVDIDALVHGPMDDKPTYDMLSRGETLNVFQLSSCLDANTIINVHNGKGMTIKSLYDMQESGKELPALNSVFFNDGRKRPDTIKKVVASGKKDIYRLTVQSDEIKGWFIDASAQHRFMTDHGWKELQELKTGDRILAQTKIGQHNLEYVCADCDTAISSEHPDKNTREHRCYKHSATHYSNPSKPESKEALSKAAKESFQNGRIPWQQIDDPKYDESKRMIGKKVSESLKGRTIQDIRHFTDAEYDEYCKNLSIRMSGKNNPMYGKKEPNAKGGFRDDLGHYVRSSWEADFARVLKYNGLDYDYEPEQFELTLDDGRTVHYTPDFYVKSLDTWFEIKGFMRDMDAMKIKAWQKKFPGRKLIIIDKEPFAQIQMKYSDLVIWECPEIPSSFGYVTIESIEFLKHDDTYDIIMNGSERNFIANGFVVHNSGMQALFKRMHPKKFEDIQASVALYRPGPMGMDAHNQYADRAAGKAPAYVINERLDKVFKNSPVDDVLNNTENLVLYQEQIMNISRFLSDFSWGDADALRKGMGHKKMDVLNAMEPKFINNAVAKGYPREETTELWEYLKKFGEYGFNSCFDGRTLVCVSIGDDDYEKMRVEDIYREHESGAPLNISILSMYPDGSIKPHKVKSITKQPLKAVTYTIRTESGKYCNVTGNHRLLTTAGYGTIDDGTLHVGAKLMIDDDWNRRLPLETLETRRKNALIASMDEHTRQVNSERMKEYQSTLSYEDRCAHQQAIQRLHPDRNDNSVKAMYYAHLNAHDNGALNGYGIMTRLSDGRVCDSRVEAQAGEYLLSRGVDFELHKPLTNKDGQVKYCDFYADGIYFEMDGLRRGRQYFVDNKYGDDIPFVYMTPCDYIDAIDAALMRHHVSNGDRIISIEPTKTLESGKPMRQTVYDIEMEHDGPANFIMQGIVSHNSHAASYAIISYETAYLKCHYPAEFMAAVLTDKIRKSKDVDDVKNAIREVREIGLKVGAIDIDNSDVGVSAVKKTSPDDPDIVFGISGIKGVSIGTAQEFVSARAKHDGKYTSVDDFMRSLPASLINKKFIDGLAGAGAFDKFGVSRRGMIACENELIDYYKSESKASAAGKESLFDFDDDDDDNNDGMGEFHIPEIQDWDWIQRLVEEEKRLGVAVSGHPLSNLGQGLEFMRKAYEISDDDYGNILTVNDAAHMKLNQYRSGRYERRPSRVIASIASIEMKTMRTGRKAIRGTIESETDSIPFAIQGDPAEKWIARFGTASGLQQNHVYVIVGNITIDYNGNHVMEAVAFEEVELDSNGRIPVWIQLTKQDRKAYKDIRAIAKKHPGDIPLMIHMNKDGYKSEVDSGLKVDCSDEFMFELEQAIGRRKFGRYAE